MIQIRHAEYNDLKSLAEIQTLSWKSAFSDILSDNTLKKYTDLDRCVKMLENVYNSNIGCFYIAAMDEKSCAELFWRRGTKSERSAEIVALHSIPESWGCGVGKAIMDNAMEDIFNNGFEKVYLWVFEQNKRARRFYEKYGFVSDGTSRISVYDKAVEIRYEVASLPCQNQKQLCS